LDVNLRAQVIANIKLSVLNSEISAIFIDNLDTVIEQLCTTCYYLDE
jgi:ABC-type dipeptide/oligopeptide/nickel transport system ATPase subunit